MAELSQWHRQCDEYDKGEDDLSHGRTIVATSPEVPSCSVLARLRMW